VTPAASTARRIFGRLQPLTLENSPHSKSVLELELPQHAPLLDAPRASRQLGESFEQRVAVNLMPVGGADSRGVALLGNHQVSPVRFERSVSLDLHVDNLAHRRHYGSI
jgi:hypothetical protein